MWIIIQHTKPEVSKTSKDMKDRKDYGAISKWRSLNDMTAQCNTCSWRESWTGGKKKHYWVSLGTGEGEREQVSTNTVKC